MEKIKKKKKKKDNSKKNDLFFYKNKETTKIEFNNKYNGRRLFEIIFQPRFLQAVIAAAFA